MPEEALPIAKNASETVAMDTDDRSGGTDGRSETEDVSQGNVIVVCFHERKFTSLVFIRSLFAPLNTWPVQEAASFAEKAYLFLIRKIAVLNK